LIVPLLHRIVVRQEKLEDTDKDYKRAAKAGIIIPEHEDNKRAQAGVDRGTIISIGATAYKDYGIDPPVQVGDLVAFARYSGKTIVDPDDNQDYVALNDEDIVAIIRKSND
jgi:co-chaperonin GroES (HSP10)